MRFCPFTKGRGGDRIQADSEMRDMDKTLRRINIQYAMVQGFYWIGYCGIFTYTAVYLQSRGYSNAQLGLVMASGCVMGFLLPQLLANWIDRVEQITVFRCLWALLLAETGLVLTLRSLPGHSLTVSVLYSVLLGLEVTINPMNTQMSTDLEHRFGRINYGMARGTGSVAFTPVTMMMGRLIEKHGTGLLPNVDLICIGIQALVLLSVCLSMRRAGPGENGTAVVRKKEGSTAIRFVQENRRFFVLMLGTMLLFFAHNLVNNYMINVVRHAGGDTSDMGLLSGFTAFMEMPMMFLYDWLTRRVRCSSTVRFASVVFAIKAAAIALARSMTALFAASVLQMFSFAMLTPAMVRYVNLYIPEKDSAKGQAISFGMVTLGNVFASLLGGVLFDHFTVPQTMMTGAASALLGAVICQIFTERGAPQVQNT